MPGLDLLLYEPGILTLPVFPSIEQVFHLTRSGHVHQPVRICFHTVLEMTCQRRTILQSQIPYQPDICRMVPFFPQGKKEKEQRRLLVICLQCPLQSLLRFHPVIDQPADKCCQSIRHPVIICRNEQFFRFLLQRFSRQQPCIHIFQYTLGHYPDIPAGQ